MKRPLGRKLTHIFGMTKKRDLLLGDLLYSLRSEGFTAHAERLAMDLAYFYNRSPDIAKCLGTTIDHIDEVDGPTAAYRLCFSMSMAAGEGPVAMLLATRLPELERKASMEDGLRRKTRHLLDSIRYKNLEDPSIFVPTGAYWYPRDDTRRYDHLHLKPTPPHEFIALLRR